MLTQLTRYGSDSYGNDISGNLWLNHPMMAGGGGNGIWIHTILALITWVLIIAVLVALLRWLWKKGDSEKSRR